LKSIGSQVATKNKGEGGGGGGGIKYLPFHIKILVYPFCCWCCYIAKRNQCENKVIFWFGHHRNFYLLPPLASPRTVAQGKLEYINAKH